MQIVRKSKKSSSLLRTLGTFAAILFCFSPLAKAGELEALKSARSEQAAGKEDDAKQTLEEALKTEKSPENRSLLLFALGDQALRLKRLPEARTYFQQALDGGTRLEDYAHFQLGLVMQQLADRKGARQQFEAVLNTKSKATQQLQFKAQQSLAEIALEERAFPVARQYLTRLQKRQKFTVDYPEVLYQLLRAERGLGNNRGMCRWARELYTKYPAHPLVASWTMELDKAVVDGRAIRCVADVRDKQARIKRLQWEGESARALSDLNELKREASWLGEFTFDSLLSSHLLYDGDAEGALKALVKHYDSHQSNPTYLMQLGKTASRAGENQAAVGAYYRAYQVAPGSRSARTALFQAAFMSYQFQDYDGATRKFEEFRKKYPTSGLARDSGWHLAWIRYLKGDYAGSYEAFKSLSSSAPKRKRVGKGKRRRWITVAAESRQVERQRYWMAMSLLKMQKTDEAKAIFSKLATDPAYGYYSIVSWYRLRALGDKATTKTEIRSSLMGTPAGESTENEPTDATRDPAAEAEEESEETIAAAAAAESEAESEATNEAEGENGEEGGTLVVEEKTLTAQFDDPYLSKRFERARDLNAMGRQDLARQELYEIELRARRTEDRRKLMQEYQAVENYNRPSYMGEIGFGAERTRAGMKDGKELWQYAFPRAFERSATSYSRSFGVPIELVWGIMKAESQFRQDVHSPVGAAGLMQLMPFTGRRVAELLDMKNFEVRDLLTADTNIRLGTRYLQRLQDKFGGSVPLVASSYNAGPHRTSAWLKSFGLLDMDEFIEHIPFIETRNYVKKVVRYYQVYSMLYAGGGNPTSSRGRTMSWLVKPVGVKSVDMGNDVW